MDNIEKDNNNQDNGYMPRLIENELSLALHSSGCVLVQGPKFVGKSYLCNRFASSKVSLVTNKEISLYDADPTLALLGEKPHLIDEWQKVPEIWNLIRADLDRDYVFGKYLLTGSTTPADSREIQHSGAGRIATLTMRPMSLYESGESNGLFSLRELFESGFDVSKTEDSYSNEMNLSDLASYLCRGGWPISVKAERQYAINATKNYYNSLFRVEGGSDEFASFFASLNVELLVTILKGFARNISTEAKCSRMVQDIRESGIRETLSEDTFYKYKKILQDLFLIYETPSMNLGLRSSVITRSAPTHHFYDTSIATACLGINPADLLNDLHSFGYFFEDMAVRDLSVYAGSLGAKIRHYRDSAGREVDAIIELENGSYAAIEIKLASDENIQKGIASLLSFQKAVMDAEQKTPEFMLVLTSHGASYKSKEGVYVIPINRLRD